VSHGFKEVTSLASLSKSSKTSSWTLALREGNVTTVFQYLMDRSRGWELKLWIGVTS
jgi:hypothetical protein